MYTQASLVNFFNGPGYYGFMNAVCFVECVLHILIFSGAQAEAFIERVKALDARDIQDQIQ